MIFIIIEFKNFIFVIFLIEFDIFVIKVFLNKSEIKTLFTNIIKKFKQKFKQFIESIRKRKFILLYYYFIEKEIAVFRDLQNTFQFLIFLFHYNRK